MTTIKIIAVASAAAVGCIALLAAAAVAVELYCNALIELRGGAQ